MNEQDSTPTMLELLERMRQMQTELDILRSRANTLPQLFEPSIPTSPKITSTRRKTLKRLGLAVLAGGAALGLTSATYAPAEARIIVNAPSNVGAVITRNGATLTGIPTGGNYGLIVSAETSLDIGTLIPPNITNPYLIPPHKIGISGFALAENEGTTNAVGGAGVYGYAAGTGTLYSTGVWGKSHNGSGVIGESDSGVGVYGVSPTFRGVDGQSDSGVGVWGGSGTGTGVEGGSDSGIGVFAETNSPTVAALAAYNSSQTGPAFNISAGGINIQGATIGSQTAAFIQQASATNISGPQSLIDNPFCNARPDALLFVTQNYNPPTLEGTSEIKTFGVRYDKNQKKWAIFLEDGTTMPEKVCFNVLVINSQFIYA